MYIRVVDGIPNKYSIHQFLQDNPHVSFPKEITNEVLEEYRVYPLKETPAPVYDKLKYKIQEDTPAQTEDGWIQKWNLVELTEQESEQMQLEKTERLRKLRQIAFEQEADPLFFKVQRGEALQQEWLDKVQEIRSRFSD
jgi:hypothetical protein